MAGWHHQVWTSIFHDILRSTPHGLVRADSRGGDCSTDPMAAGFHSLVGVFPKDARAVIAKCSVVEVDSGESRNGHVPARTERISPGRNQMVSHKFILSPKRQGTRRTAAIEEQQGHFKTCALEEVGVCRCAGLKWWSRSASEDCRIFWANCAQAGFRGHSKALSGPLGGG